MKYVLDSCVALKWVLSEPDADKAVKIRDGLRQGLHELIVPYIFPVEAAHNLSKSERRGIILAGEGAKKVADVFRFMPDLHPYLPLLPRAFAISIAAPHDGSMIACTSPWPSARAATLVTADMRLIANLQPIYSSIVPLSSWP